MYIMMSIKIYPAAIAGLASLALIAVAFLLSPLAHAALTPTVGCIEFGDTGADVYRVGAVFETVSKSSRSQINYMGNDVCLDANRLREYYCYTYTSADLKPYGYVAGNMSVRNVEVSCKNGCYNGACKAETTPTPTPTPTPVPTPVPTPTPTPTPDPTPTPTPVPTPTVVNQAPVVSVVGDVRVTFPNQAYLQGLVRDDGLPIGSRLNFVWMQVTWPGPGGVTSVPGSVSFSNQTSASTSVAFSAPGTYALRLSADDGARASWDQTMVVVDSRGAIECGKNTCLDAGIRCVGEGQDVRRIIGGKNTVRVCAPNGTVLYKRGTGGACTKNYLCESGSCRSGRCDSLLYIQYQRMIRGGSSSFTPSTQYGAVGTVLQRLINLIRGN